MYISTYVCITNTHIERERKEEDIKCMCVHIPLHINREGRL